MYIKKLIIKNFRNFSNPPFEIELQPFTLILGENNIGKTNLLKALALIFSQDVSMFRRRVLEIEDINFQAVEKFKKDVSNLKIPNENVVFPEVKISVEMVELDLDQSSAAGDWPTPGNSDLTSFFVSYLFAPKISFNKSEWVKTIRENFEEIISVEEKLQTIDFPIGEYRYSLFGSNDSSQKCDLYYLNMFKMDLLDALRDTQRELIASDNGRLLFRVLNQKDQTKYGDIKAILETLNSAINTNSNLSSIQKEVENLLDQVSLESETTDNSVSFRFTSPETTEILKKLSLLYGSNPVDVIRNGLGRNNLLYISLLLSRLADNDIWNNQTVFRLISIEEPEAHLHPHLQDHLAGNIKNIQEKSEGKIQLILTSHSTHIAAKLNLENTVTLYKESKTGRVENHYILSGLDTKKEKNSIRYLKRYLDATKSRMFFARKIILVEGISEQFLLPLFFKGHTNLSLEKTGCNVINVNGISFAHFLKIIKGGFFIKCLVLTDSDKETKTDQRAIDLRSTYSDEIKISVQISEQSTFEKDLISYNISGSGKKTLESALTATRPIVGAKLIKNAWSTDDFFSLIENYKSEFSFNLAQELEKDINSIELPKYIIDGLDFLVE